MLFHPKSLTMENNEDITSSYITTCVLNAFLTCNTVMLDCLTIYALTKLSSLPRPLKTLPVNLAVSNPGVGLMVQPLYIASLVMEMEQKTENNPAYNINVQFLKSTLNLFGFTSFGVTFLSLDRFPPTCLPPPQILGTCDPQTCLYSGDF